MERDEEIEVRLGTRQAEVLEYYTPSVLMRRAATRVHDGKRGVLYRFQRNTGGIRHLMTHLLHITFYESHSDMKMLDSIHTKLNRASR